MASTGGTPSSGATAGTQGPTRTLAQPRSMASTSSLAPIAPAPSRRRSDSTLTRGDVRSDPEEREKLRRWAADAMTAPPPLMEPDEPVLSSSTPPISETFPRRSARSRRSQSPSILSSRGTGDGGNDLAGLVGRGDGSLGRATEAADWMPSSSSRRQSLFSARTSARSPSPAAMMTSIKHSDNMRRPQSAGQESNCSTIQNHSPLQGPVDVPKGLAQRRMESGQLDGELLNSVKSVRITEQPYTVAPDGTRQIALERLAVRTARPKTIHTQRRLFSPRSTDGQPPTLSLQDLSLTPRPGEGDSPLSTTSTCASEDDDERSVTTPDGANAELLPAFPRSLRRGRSRLANSVSAASVTNPPMDVSTPLAALPDIDTSINTLSHTQDSPITNYLSASGRRGSTSVYDPPPNKTRAEAGEPSEPGDQLAPPMSYSTLLGIGEVEGLTPPIVQSGSEIGSISVSESGNAVSAGLEMGLGARMATTALATHLPQDHSDLQHLAERRFSRSGGLTTSSPAVVATRKDSEVASSDHDVHHMGGAGSRSDQAVDDMSDLRDQTLPSAELSRRRTTGWDATRLRREGLTSEKRGIRAATQDEYISSTPLVGKEHHVTFAPLRDATESAQVGIPRDRPSSAAEVRFSGFSAGAESTISSFDSRSTNRRASRTGSALDTPSLGARGRPMLSPDVHTHYDSIRGSSGGLYDSLGQGAGDERVRMAKQRQVRDEAQGNQASYGNNGGLMGSNVAGHFGPGIRAKVIEVLDPLIAMVPLTGTDGETVNLVEYGCLNSRSIPLIQLIISKVVHRAHARTSLSIVQEEVNLESNAQASHFSAASRSDQFAEVQSSRVNFSIVHEDSQSSDFRPILQSLDNRTESYLDASWQALHRPSLQNSLFPSFVARPFASRICPPATMHFGLALMDLHWSHVVNPAVSLATCAHAELASFLQARAHEFKTGGVLVVAFLARSDGTSDNATTKDSGPKDIWTTLRKTLAPCIQRLVSCGMLKSEVARHLLDLPLHPRTPRQTLAVLDSVRHSWKLEWSCGLGEQGVIDPELAVDVGAEMSSPISPTRPRVVHAQTPTSSYHSPMSARSRSNSSLLRNEPSSLRIAHPAWKAYSNGTLSAVALAEHMIMLFKNLYETHFRTVLRERGKLSKGAAEFVLDSLWDVLSSRIDDDGGGGAGSMEDVEIEVTVCALRRL